jgi:hypothetical protein
MKSKFEEIIVKLDEVDWREAIRTAAASGIKALSDTGVQSIDVESFGDFQCKMKLFIMRLNVS